MKTRMPGKWGGARRAPPLDPPMATEKFRAYLKVKNNVVTPHAHPFETMKFQS